MKSCIIVNFWADNTYKIDILANCLKQLKKTGIDIVYTSKYPVPRKINDLVKYCIYTSDNDLITIQDLLNSDVEIVNTMSHHIGYTSFYTCPLNYYNVSYSVHTQLRNNLNFLKNLGYTHYHLLVGDCIISDEDLKNFTLVEEFIELSNKKAYFEDLNGKFNGYSALYWFSEIDFFLNKTLSFKDKQSFITHYASKPNTIEFLPYEIILRKDFINSSDVVCANNNSWDFGHLITFRKSKLNIIDSYNTLDVFTIVPDKEHIYSNIFIISREGGNYKLKLNDEEFIYNLSKNSWQSYITHSKNFNLKIYKEDKIIVDIEIDEIMLDKIWSYSFFE